MSISACQFSPSSPSLSALTEVEPHTIELPQMMVLPVTEVSPQTMEFPQMIESLKRALLPQTMEFPQMIELPQVMLLPEVTEIPLLRVPCLVDGLKTAVGEVAPPDAMSELWSAASTSR